LIGPEFGMDMPRLFASLAVAYEYGLPQAIEEELLKGPGSPGYRPAWLWFLFGRPTRLKKPGPLGEHMGSESLREYKGALYSYEDEDETPWSPCPVLWGDSYHRSLRDVILYYWQILDKLRDNPKSLAFCSGDTARACLCVTRSKRFALLITWLDGYKIYGYRDDRTGHAALLADLVKLYYQAEAGGLVTMDDMTDDFFHAKGGQGMEEPVRETFMFAEPGEDI
jgi:hypothetical protein